jgi:hypothetical protein
VGSVARARQGGGKATVESYSRTRAAWTLGQWRRQGFDALVCLPTGVCAPVSSSSRLSDLPEGSRLHALDAEEALAALAAATRAGFVYRP